MTMRSLIYLAHIALAVLVPVAALAAAAGDAESVVAPFGWIDIAVVHLLTLLPLSLLIAKAVPHPDVWPTSLFVGGTWLVLALGIAWWTASRGALLAGQFDSSASGFFPARVLIRFLWCLCLQLPWCLSAKAWMVPSSSVASSWISTGLATTLGLLCALFLPAVYARSVIDAQTTKAEELLRSGRLVHAQPVVQHLCDVASSKPIGGLKPHELRRKIEQNIRAFTNTVSKPLPDSASDKVRLERARAFAVLSRNDEAVQILKPLAQSDASACILLAAVLQNDKRWRESSEAYRAVLRLLDARPVQEAAALAKQVSAYDSLAFNAREQAAYQEAEAIYFEAMAALPAAKAHFHHQLGRHYQLGGRPVLAIEHLETAARLSPEPYGKLSQPYIDQITLRTPSCLLRWMR